MGGSIQTMSSYLDCLKCGCLPLAQVRSSFTDMLTNQGITQLCPQNEFSSTFDFLKNDRVLTTNAD